MRRVTATLFVLLTASGVFAQQPAAWSYTPITAGQPPAPPVATGLPDQIVVEELPYDLPDPPPVAAGQQHWVALNLGVFQPFAGRLQVKVLPRANNSIWAEVYAGGALYHEMYGFGGRLMHTAWDNDRGDAILVSPGLGLHVLPDWRYAREYHRGYHVDYLNTLYFLAGDVDVSWVHDFGPRFAFELGLKAGLAGRVGGQIGNHYPRSATFGKDVYPIFSLYSGLRF